MIGDLKFESDRPKACMTYDYVPNSHHDFYKCI